ncbi:hypothetical protein LWI28_021187 [Acer negundo]|uniref:Uncharacterized protein n=1 Tax=Acer negundo TaxID=4023 RepID=A0AAD5IV89_ACENE|nr:hypothetical protein LWI28_021187 [Acer negundo]
MKSAIYANNITLGLALALVFLSLTFSKSNLANRRSVKVFDSKDRSSGGVSVSGNQVVYFNFEEDKDLKGVNIDGPAIDFFVDLRGLDPFVRKGKVGSSVDSLCSSIARLSNKIFFPPRSHRMKTRSVACGIDS